MTTITELMVDALRLIGQGGCAAFTRGTCETHGLTRDAPPGDRWCRPCIANDALSGVPRSRPAGATQGDETAPGVLGPTPRPENGTDGRADHGHGPWVMLGSSPLGVVVEFSAQLDPDDGLPLFERESDNHPGGGTP